MTDPALQQLAETALVRHRDLARSLRAIADDLSPSRRQPWLDMAEILTTGNTPAACRAAVRQPAIWLPLLTSNDSDSCFDQLIVLATTPRRLSAIRRGSTLYALVVTAGLLILLNLLARSVLPIFREMLESFQLELPVVTQLVLGIGTFLGDGKILLLCLAGAVAVISFVVLFRTRRARRRGLFVDSLGQLLAGGFTPPEALSLTATFAGISNHGMLQGRADHWLQHSPAATAAYSAAPAAVPTLLNALAENYADRAAQRQHTADWLLGPIAVVLMGFAVGFTTLVLFLPLIRLLEALS